MSTAVQTKRPKCPECGSKQVLYRSRTNTQRCRLCGALWAVQAQQHATLHVPAVPIPGITPGHPIEGELTGEDAPPQEPAPNDAAGPSGREALVEVAEKIEVAFDDKGLVAAVAQDARTGEVLMLAYMDREALRRTLESGQAWFYSRSRQELWHKGATSGHFLSVRGVSLDCDGDAVLLKVDPEGPACHTGNRSCFFTPLTAESASR